MTQNGGMRVFDQGTVRNSEERPMTSEPTAEHSRIPYAKLGLKHVGKKYRGTLDGNRVTIRVVDVTFGADVVIRRRSYGQSTMSQGEFLAFVQTAKEIE
jgi:hypothetical protein